MEKATEYHSFAVSEISNGIFSITFSESSLSEDCVRKTSDELIGFIQGNSGKKFVLNLERVQFCSSLGAGLFIRITGLDVPVVFCGLSGKVATVLQLLRIYNLLPQSDSQAKAVTTLSRMAN